LGGVAQLLSFGINGPEQAASTVLGELEGGKFVSTGTRVFGLELPRFTGFPEAKGRGQPTLLL